MELRPAEGTGEGGPRRRPRCPAAGLGRRGRMGEIRPLSAVRDAREHERVALPGPPAPHELSGARRGSQADPPALVGVVGAPFWSEPVSGSAARTANGPARGVVATSDFAIRGVWAVGRPASAGPASFNTSGFGWTGEPAPCSRAHGGEQVQKIAHGPPFVLGLRLPGFTFDLGPSRLFSAASRSAR